MKSHGRWRAVGRSHINKEETMDIAIYIFEIGRAHV